MATGLAVPAAAQAAEPTPQPTAGAAKSVTLITGDRVLVENGAPRSIKRAPGRDQVVFSTYRQGENTYVLPDDVTGLIADGRLDRRLFDVAGLIANGYDDAKRRTLPVLVSRQSAGVRVTRELPGTALAAAEAPRTAAGWQAQLAQLQSTKDTKVWLDGVRKPSLDRSVPQIGAPTAWQAGYTGKGVKVAVLDTGVDANHPDLKGKQSAEQNFTDDPDATDTVGHGTHVASTIASGDAKFRGVAPDSQIMDGKVCAQYGCLESWILAGMQWAAEQGADVVNLSLGGSDTPELDPLEDAINKLSAQHGTLFVVAAGNSGTRAPVSSPATADAALAVGAVDRDDKLAPFSSRGPRVGDGAVKPDVTAPGVDIVAAKAGTTERVAYSGTSMATPHAAGAAALIAQQHPDWIGAQIKAVLVASAKPNPALTGYEQGAGRIDLARAITPQLTTDPVSLGLGIHQWPHQDDKPVTKEVSYRNPGTSELVLDLKLDTTAPAGMFTVSPAKLTVPAGGSAKASVTGDSRVGSEDKAFTATLVATAGQTSARTVVGLQREVESYDVTLNHKDRNGAAPERYGTVVWGLDSPAFLFAPYEADGSTTMRLPKGRYYTMSSISGQGGPNGRTVDLLSHSEITVAGSTTVDYDARQAKPISITGPATTPLNAVVIVSRSTATSGLTGFFFAPTFEGFGIAGFGPRQSAAEHSIAFSGLFQDQDSAKHVYAFQELGQAPTGFERKVAKSTLAEVHTTLGPLKEGRLALFGIGAVFASGSLTSLFDVEPPTAPTYFVTTEPGIAWGNTLYQESGTEANPEIRLSAADRQYRAGRRYDERLNFAVFGPSLPAYYRNIARRGDTLGVGITLFADQPGGSGDTMVLDSAFTKLYREGKLIGETADPAYGYFEKLPAGRATYRVDTEAVRSVADLSTRVSASWTFKSDTVAGTEFKPVPMSVVRFEPKLSDANTAPAGRLFWVPLRVEQAKNAPNGRISKVEVEASFDDGKSWRRVPVLGDNALVPHPAKAGFVSLRAKAFDTKGNNSEVTIVRAYKIG